MANPHSKRRKEKVVDLKLAQRLTARWVPIYLAIDLAIVAMLYFLFPVARMVLVGMAWWYWPVIYVPFALLTFFERSDAPFVFNKMMSGWRLVFSSVVLALALVGIRVFFVRTLPFEFSPCSPPPSEPNLFGAILAVANAGLSEEPFKAFLINAIALVLQQRFRFRLRNYSLDYQFNRKRDMVWVGGIISVGIWALLHVPLACYQLFDFTVAFMVGLVLFVVLLRTRDLRFVIVTHALFDFLVPMFMLNQSVFLR